jgi:hypothetical protein
VRELRQGGGRRRECRPGDDVWHSRECCWSEEGKSGGRWEGAGLVRFVSCNFLQRDVESGLVLDRSRCRERGLRGNRLERRTDEGMVQSLRKRHSLTWIFPKET